MSDEVRHSTITEVEASADIDPGPNPIEPIWVRFSVLALTPSEGRHVVLFSFSFSFDLKGRVVSMDRFPRLQFMLPLRLPFL